MMTRCEAREHWGSSGLTYDILSPENLKSLRDRIDTSLRESGLMKSYRANPAPKAKISAGKKWAEISCAAFYFTKREAVTFNPNGFVGFAGWADDYNVQPILSAFCGWVDDLSSSKMAA